MWTFTEGFADKGDIVCKIAMVLVCALITQGITGCRREDTQGRAKRQARESTGTEAGANPNLEVTSPGERNKTLAGPSMDHAIIVPKRFSAGRGWHGAPSDIERYVEAYEDGYWSCINLHAKDIDYQSTESDKVGIGWPARVEGVRQGFEDAEARIKENIRRFGKERTQAHLKEIWEGW